MEDVFFQLGNGRGDVTIKYTLEGFIHNHGFSTTFLKQETDYLGIRKSEGEELWDISSHGDAEDVDIVGVEESIEPETYDGAGWETELV